VFLSDEQVDQLRQIVQSYLQERRDEESDKRRERDRQTRQAARDRQRELDCRNRWQEHPERLAQLLERALQAAPTNDTVKTLATMVPRIVWAAAEAGGLDLSIASEQAWEAALQRLRDKLGGRRRGRPRTKPWPWEDLRR
jgi:hypothetical protein